MNAIEFEGVSKSYPVYDSPGHRLSELATLNRIRRHRDFWALRELTFDVRAGETFCIIGENGSGKSTLLQCVAGILQPTAGAVRISGRVSALLELGAGFNPHFSGRDNVYLNGAILGFSSAEMDSKYRAIAEFAEIGEFIDRPVNTYSSGMVVRLAFAVAIHVDPEILLVDEALAVGDIYFRQRCLRKVHELRSRGITVLFVSHSIGDVKAIGDRTLWLEHGRIREIGDTDRVVAKYLAAMVEKDTAFLRHGKRMAALEAPEVVDVVPNIDRRHGDERAEVIGIAVLDAFGRPLHLLEPLTRIIVRISVRARETIGAPVAGYMIRNHLGMDFSGTNTARERADLAPLEAGAVRTIDFQMELPELYPSSFSFSLYIADGPPEAGRICDWIDNAVTLQMGHGDGQVYGYMHLPCRVELDGRIGPEPAAARVAEAPHA